MKFVNLILMKEIIGHNVPYQSQLSRIVILFELGLAVEVKKKLLVFY